MNFYNSESKVLKVGLEVHRVISHKKLFCKCTYKTSERWAGFKEVFETEYPIENKINTYTHNYAQYCDYEKDDYPPLLCHKTLLKALKIVSRFPQIEIPDFILFNRKHIKDGSIPKGYQISGVVGANSTLTLSTNKKINISRIYLEQDSCTIKDHGGTKMYDTARLGLPLLEIVTEPCILTAAEVKETLIQIEKYLNLDHNLYKSSFSIRQDINISDPRNETKKIEFKGIDRLSTINTIFDVADAKFLQERQDTTVTIKGDASEVLYLRPCSTSKRIHPETDLGLFKSKIFTKKSIKEKHSLLRENDLELAPLIQKKKHLKLLSMWIKKHQLKKTDIMNFITLYPIHKQKTYYLYPLYLTNKLSIEGLKKNLFIEPYPEQKLVHLYQNMNQAEFYKTYKLYIPRNFKQPTLINP